MDTIDLYSKDGTLLANSLSIDANSNELLSFILTLPYDLGDKVYEIKLGKDYTGYYYFTLEKVSAVGLSIGPTILGIFILGTVIVIINRRKQN